MMKSALVVTAGVTLATGAAKQDFAATEIFPDVTSKPIADVTSKPIAFLPLGTILAGSTTDGSAVIAGLRRTTYIAAGMPVIGVGIPDGTVVIGIVGNSRVTISKRATGTGRPLLKFGSSIWDMPTS